MRTQITNEPDPLPISRTGVIVAEGFGLRLFVHRGVLVIEDGDGPKGRRAQLVRSAARGARIVLLGLAGTVSLDAIRWMAQAEVGFAVIDAAAGRIVAAGDTNGTDKPPLRRAQAMAIERPVGLVVAKRLIREKLSGQHAVLQDRFELAADDINDVGASLVLVEEADDVRRLRSLEADAASIYWNAWRSLELAFARKDQERVPEHWRLFPGRGSPIAGTGPRAASCPMNAILNLSYALGEIEARIACLTMGLDPGLGVLHSDQPARDSLALDLLEAIRPVVDRWVIDTVRTHTFRKADFYETKRGVFRVGPELARSMGDLMPTWRRALAPVVEEIAIAIGESGERPIRVATRLTEVRRREGRGARSSRLRLRVCQMCGAALEGADRKICDQCLPDYDLRRTERLATAGKTTLAAMRASADDPAKTPEARAKVAEKSRERMRAIRAWERKNGKVIDRERYERDILPSIGEMTVPALMAATGLSQHYCWQVRSGRKRLHPMHWLALGKDAQIDP